MLKLDVEVGVRMAAVNLRISCVVFSLFLMWGCSPPQKRVLNALPDPVSGESGGNEEFNAPPSENRQPTELADAGTTAIEDLSEEPDVPAASDVPPQISYECELGVTESCVTECATVGERTCGKYWGPCVPPEEICNQVDDNCDGSIDEGVTNACGECGAVPEEICDDLDNDCDGLVDEDVPGGCGCNGPTLQGEIQVNIPELSPDCPFGEGDNLNPAGGKMAARVEQNVSFKIPTDITLCSFEIVGGSSDFYFDDHFILTLNNVVLIASFDWKELKNSGNNLFQYSWPGIAGKDPSGDGPSCMAGATLCEMPNTQSYGKVKLAFDQATNNQLVQTGQNGKHKFKVIATGDNDPSKDCYHNGISLKIKYNYLN